MTGSNESEIIKQYKSLIQALIPFQQENRLLEGLNKFSSRLPSNVRNILKEEVLRLTAVTDASADNSDFALFPVKKFKHFGISMRLDKVGQEILKRETSRYLERYTVGVFESIMSSDHYQSIIKRDQQKKIVDAFTVEAQSLGDIDFGQDLAVRPNFTVHANYFENGKNCPLVSLSAQSMTVETKRTPLIADDAKVMKFIFPDVPGFVRKGTEVVYELESIQFNKASSKFETLFRLSLKNPPRLRGRLAEYIPKVIHQLPLERELELERAMQDLERDRLLENSPWIPIFLEQRDAELVPIKVLMSQVNLDYNKGFDTIAQLPCKNIFSKLITELHQHQESFLLKGTFQTKNGPIVVAATHRELSARKLLKQFIAMIMESDDFSVLQCRLAQVGRHTKETAYAIHDMLQSDYPELSDISQILFCKNVTQWVGKLKVACPDAFKPFPKSIIDDQDNWPLNVVMAEELDRRSEPRFYMGKPATVKLSMFNSLEATLDDLSVSGLKVTISKPPKSGLQSEEVKISVPDLKLKGEKYQVVHFDPGSGVLRLKLAQAKGAGKSTQLNSMLDKNSAYFKQRNITVRYRNLHRFLWELSIRNLPSVAILITRNRHVLDRLKTVYANDNSRDLYPFATIGHEVALNGFLADKDATKPKSSLLTKMLSHSQQDAHVIHAVRQKDKRIIYIDEQDFLYGKIREQISQYVEKNTLQACVAHLSAIKCESPNTPLTEKRLAQLSKIDMEDYEKLKNAQKIYSHVLYITDVSSFHNALLQFGIFPQSTSN